MYILESEYGWACQIIVPRSHRPINCWRKCSRWPKASWTIHRLVKYKHWNIFELISLIWILSYVYHQLLGLVKQTDMTERKIQRWMRLRAAQNRPTLLSKFTESAWRCNFYACMFAYGVFILWDVSSNKNSLEYNYFDFVIVFIETLVLGFSLLLSRLPIPCKFCR